MTVFVAEVGDKSQLLIIAMAARYRSSQVMAGVVVSAVLTQTLSVTLGAAAGETLSADGASVVAGVLFIAFALWAVLESDDSPEQGRLAPRGGPAVLVVIGAIFLAEMGDKTMFATAALAATNDPITAWIGSFAALVGAALIALGVGQQLGARVSAPRIRAGSAVVFVLVGVGLLFAGLR